MPTLKPCPFCGGEGTHHNGVDEKNVLHYLICCRDCNATAGWSPVLHEAENDWNQRK